jgi:hypothetical protein
VVNLLRSLIADAESTGALCVQTKSTEPSGRSAENLPEASALDALDRFLSYVDSKRAEGRVVYATSSEIADLAFPM